MIFKLIAWIRPNLIDWGYVKWARRERAIDTICRFAGKDIRRKK